MSAFAWGVTPGMAGALALLIGPSTGSGLRRDGAVRGGYRRPPSFGKGVNDAV